MSRLRHAIKATAIVISALSLSTLVSLNLNQINFIDLYTKRFGFDPGPWFSEHIAPAIGKPNFCIIVGASTAREGIFDIEDSSRVFTGSNVRECRDNGWKHRGG